MSPGRRHDLMVGTHYGTVRAILAHQALDHLIGLLPPPGIHDLHAGPVLALLHRMTLLPPVEHHGQGMPFSMAVGSQILQKGFPRHFRSGREATSEEVIAVDNEVCGHQGSRYRGNSPPVNAGHNLHKPLTSGDTSENSFLSLTALVGTCDDGLSSRPTFCYWQACSVSAVSCRFHFKLLRTAPSPPPPTTGPTARIRAGPKGLRRR